MSRSTELSLRPSIYWRRINLFDAPQTTRARSDTSVLNSKFKVMRYPSSPGAATHSDCVLGATSIKRFANSLEVAGSAGCSAPTDHDRFFCRSATLLRFRNSVGSASVTLLGGWSGSFLSVPRHWLCGTTLISVAFDGDYTFATAHCLKSEVSHS